jgi:hypothetical protein
LRDAVELEWAGVPSVAIIHESQEGSAKAMALVSGMPDYQFVIVRYPHPPLALWDQAEIAEIVKEVAAEVRDRLTTRREPALSVHGNGDPAASSLGTVRTPIPAGSSTPNP